MDTGTMALVALAVAAGGFVQGLAGLGFALVSAPVVTQIVGGPPGVGLVNALSIVQNVWLIYRTEGRIAWRIIGGMAPGLVIGVALGWLVLRRADPDVYALIVAVSACASVVWLLLASRVRGVLAGSLSAVWGALVNTVAGVGGPPLAAYLVTRGLDFSIYLRTLQVVFATLSLVSLPLLGIAVPSIPAVLAWVLALLVGSSAGEWLRHRIADDTAQRVGKTVIVVVCVVALIRAIAVLD